MRNGTSLDWNAMEIGNVSYVFTIPFTLDYKVILSTWVIAKPLVKCLIF